MESLSFIDHEPLDREVLSHFKWVMTQSKSLKEALTRLAPTIHKFSNPAPYAFSILYILTQVPSIEKYAEQYRANRQYLVTDDEINESYNKEYPAWMRSF